MADLRYGGPESCGLEQRAVDDAIDQWRRRLLACVDTEGGHFEHNLGL